MEPAVLFWFYKKEGVCTQRLRILRQMNPMAKIYGLYGGPVSEAPRPRPAWKAIWKICMCSLRSEAPGGSGETETSS